MTPTISIPPDALARLRMLAEQQNAPELPEMRDKLQGLKDKRDSDADKKQPENQTQ